VDPLILAEKLESLRRCVKRVEDIGTSSTITHDGVEDFRSFAAGIASMLKK